MAKKIQSKQSPASFNYKTIKSFEDACAKVGVDPSSVPSGDNLLKDLAAPIVAAYKLMIIYLAINNGWKPSWSNRSQWKYYPYFWFSSSGFGFSSSDSYCGRTFTDVGLRLCTDSSEKALYVAEQFKELYEDLFLIKE